MIVIVNAESDDWKSQIKRGKERKSSLILLLYPCLSIIKFRVIQRVWSFIRVLFDWLTCDQKSETVIGFIQFTQDILWHLSYSLFWEECECCPPGQWHGNTWHGPCVSFVLRRIKTRLVSVTDDLDPAQPLRVSAYSVVVLLVWGHMMMWPGTEYTAQQHQHHSLPSSDAG